MMKLLVDGFSTKITLFRQELRVLVYPSSIDLSSRTLRFLTGQLTARRQEIGTRWRRLPAGRQALLVLAHLRCGDTYAQLAAGFGIAASHVAGEQATPYERAVRAREHSEGTVVWTVVKDCNSLIKSWIPAAAWDSEPAYSELSYPCQSTFKCLSIRTRHALGYGTGSHVKHYGHVENVRLLVVDNYQPIADLAATAARYEGGEAVTANSGYLFGGLSNVVEQVISRLRRKLDGDYGDTEGNGKDEPQRIHTVRGVGYVVRQVTE